MAKYRIYNNNDHETIHEDYEIEVPVSIQIGETIIYYSVSYKVISIVHHISIDLKTTTDLHVVSNETKN
nr:hypothetical protein [Bacteroidota bacterium]